MWEVFHFFVSFAEVVVVVASILIAGLIAAVGVFWILSRILGKVADPSEGSDSPDDEMDGYTTPPSHNIGERSPQFVEPGIAE